MNTVLLLCTMTKMSNKKRDRVESQCENCGKSFIAYPGKRYCNRKCYFASKKPEMVNFSCIVCGSNFLVTTKRALTVVKYCSRSCKSKGMSVKIEVKCQSCGLLFIDYPSRKYCSKACKTAGHVLFMKEHKQQISAKLKKTYADPALRLKMSKISKRTWDRDNERLLGLVKKSWENDDRKKKAAVTARKTSSNPIVRAKISETQRKRWADGKRSFISNGRCGWYDYKRPNGTNIKLQGSWEIVYAMYLDENHISYTAHEKTLTYTDSNGIKRTYYPDFYLTERDEFIDVKGRYTDACREKFECIWKSNPTLKITLLRKDDLKAIGIDVCNKGKEFLLRERSSKTT